MKSTYPHTIKNCIGETLTFTGEEQTEEGIKVFVEGRCDTGAGPAFHVHFKQTEVLTVVSGKMGYQYWGQEPKFVNPGETVRFEPGSVHKFWAEGGPLVATGWVSPANSIMFYLSALYAAQNKSGKGQPETFDGAYLLTRYASEYSVGGLPAFVKKFIIPLTYRIGKLLGKYDHFKDAPAPII